MSNYFKKITKLVKSYQECEFILMNRGIMRELGVNPTLILSELLSRFNYHASKNELEKDGSFYCKIDKLEELTTLKYKAQASAIVALEKKGLVKADNRDGNVRYFTIMIDAVYALIEKFSKKVAKKEKTENPKGKTSDTPKEKPVLPKRTIPINKKALTKTKNKNLNNNTKHNTSSSSSSKKKKEKTEDITTKRHMAMLENFLQTKGFSGYLVTETIKQFISKSITRFSVADLEKAYKTMIHHHEKIKKVMYPPTFFANGVALILPKMEIPKKPIVETVYPPIPLYNWLEQ